MRVDESNTSVALVFDVLFTMPWREIELNKSSFCAYFVFSDKDTHGETFIIPSCIDAHRDVLVENDRHLQFL